MMAMLAIATRARFMIYLPLKNNMRRSASDQPTNAVTALGSKGWLLTGRPDTIPRHTSGRGSRGEPSRKMSYCLDSHCDGTPKNSDEKQVTMGQCKATTEAREQRKSDQLA